MFLPTAHRKLIILLPLLVFCLLIFAAVIALVTIDFPRTANLSTGGITILLLVALAWIAIVLLSVSLCRAVISIIKPLSPLSASYLIVRRAVGRALIRWDVSYFRIARNKWLFLFLCKAVPSVAALCCIGFLGWLLLWIGSNPTRTPENSIFVVVGALLAIGAMTAAVWVQNRYAFLGSAEAMSVLTSDARPPILFLRSFGDDDAEVIVKMFPVRRKIRLEKLLSETLGKFGPVIAIGRPGEDVPQLGAARSYFSDDAWRATISEWVQKADTIVAIAASSEGIAWELATIKTHDYLGKMILVSPYIGNKSARRWERIGRLLEGTALGNFLASAATDDLVMAQQIDNGRVLAVRSRELSGETYNVGLEVIRYWKTASRSH